MGNQVKDVGGGRARPVAGNFLNFLNDVLYNNNGNNTGVAGALNYFLGGDVSQQADSLRAIQEKQKNQDLATLRAGFGQNVSSTSGVANTAAATYLANRGPQDELAINNLLDSRRLQALQLLLPMFGQAVGLGTTQRQLIQQPTFGQSLLDFGLGAGQAAIPFFASRSSGGGNNKTVNPGGNVGGGYFG